MAAKQRINTLAMRESKYTQEQKEWILARFACNWSCTMIREEFEAEFGRKPPAQQTLSGYKARYSEQIKELRESQLTEMIRLGLPFVRKLERVAEYGRIAKIEQRRKDYDAECQRLRDIAEEMGDLKQQHEHSGTVGFDDLSAEQHIAAIRSIIGGTGEAVAGPELGAKAGNNWAPGGSKTKSSQ